MGSFQSRQQDNRNSVVAINLRLKLSIPSYEKKAKNSGSITSNWLFSPVRKIGSYLPNIIPSKQK